MPLSDHLHFAHHERQPIPGFDFEVERQLTPEEQNTAEIEHLVTGVQFRLHVAEMMSGGDEEEQAKAEAQKNRAKDMFAGIVERTYEKSYTLAFSQLRIGGDELVLEVLSASYARAFEALGKFRRDSKFETWFHRIVVNQSHNAYRREKKHRHERLIEDDKQDYKISALNVLEAAPEYAGMQLWQNERLVSAINLLNDKDREIVILHGIRELPYEEIVEMIGSNENALKVRFHRALKKLKASLFNMGIESIDDLTTV